MELRGTNNHSEPLKLLGPNQKKNPSVNDVHCIVAESDRLAGEAISICSSFGRDVSTKKTRQRPAIHCNTWKTVNRKTRGIVTL